MLKRILAISFYLLLYSAIAFGGFATGIIYEQVLLMKGAGYIMSMGDVDVTFNFNETKMVEEVNKTLVPALTNAFNQSIQDKGK